jgi:two-component system response regulator NreC
VSFGGERIVIADDHGLLRSGLRRLLANEPGLEVIAECADGPDTLRAVEIGRPDLVLLDLDLPRGNGTELIGQLRMRFAGVRILVLSDEPQISTVREALAVGASGILLKTSGFHQLRDAIATVLRGHLYVDPDLRLEPRSSTRAAVPLTERERAVLILLARGATYRDVGHHLHIGERTVETHRRRIADKLGLKTRAELVTYAIEQGLLETTSSLTG